MTLKRTRLFGCVRFVFYSGILRTAPLWVHIIRAVSAKQNKGQRQYPRREFSYVVIVIYINIFLKYPLKNKYYKNQSLPTSDICTMSDSKRYALVALKKVIFT